MSERSVRVRLEAQTAAYMAAMRQASAVTQEFARNIAGAGEVADKNLERVGRSALIAAGGLTVGLGMSAKAAINWESAFAGVRKTVDGTAEQMATLEEGLRGMARELPATHAEIAGVAEAAGQLGIAVPNIERFTKVMIDLGETTNLTAQDAAMQLARLTAITGMAEGDFGRLGSTIVDLGNNMQTTEAEIVALGMRLAGAGNQVGMSEAQIMGLAAGLSSLGIQAEMGGTAFSRVIIEIQKAVQGGTEELDVFAAAAGMSASQFARAFEEDAAAAIVSVISGLGNLQKSGGNVNAVLETMGLDAMRVGDTMRRTAGSGELLSDALELANNAWRENTALATEAELRYETTAAQFEILRNQAVDLGIGMGEVMLPAINAAVGGTSNLLTGIRELPGPLNEVAVGIGGVSAAGLGVVGVMGVMGPKVRQAKDALATMGTGAQFVGRNLGAISGVLLGVGAAVGVAAIAYERATRSSREYEAAVRDLASAMADVIQGQTQIGDVIGEQVGAWGAGLDDSVIEGLDRVGIKFEDIEQSILAGGDALEPLRDMVRELGIDLDGWDVGQLDNIAMVGPIERFGEALGLSYDQVKSLINGLEDLDDVAQGAAQRALTVFGGATKATQALVDAAVAANTAADGTVNYAAAAADVGLEADVASSNVDDLSDGFDANGDAAKTAADAVRDLVESYRSGFDVLFRFMDAQAAIDDHHRQVARSAKAAADARQEAVRAANEVAEAERGVAEAMRMVVDEQEAARRGIDRLAASQRAAIDPLFAVMDALERQQEVLNPKRRTDRPKKPGEATRTSASPAAGPSALDAAEAAANVDQAFLRLAGAIRTGDVSLTNATQMLQRWVQQGGLTQAQADELAKKFAEAAHQSQVLHGATVEQAAAHEIATAWMEAEEERAGRVRDANERLRDAKERLRDAQERARDAADDHARAAEGLERKVLDLHVAAIELNGAIAANPQLVNDAIRKLDEWVRQGHITEEQAARLRDRFREIARAADNLSGREIRIRLHLEGQAEILAQLDEIARKANEPLIHNLSPVARDRILDGTRARGGPTLPYGTYLVGEEGPELLTMGAQAGYVTPHAPSMAAMASWGDWTGTGAARGTLAGGGGSVTHVTNNETYNMNVPPPVAARMDERELVGELGLMQWGKGRRR